MEARDHKTRASVLRELGGQGLRVVRRRTLIQGTSSQPGAEELWARLRSEGPVPVIYRDLPYKRVHANLQIPVSSGCELAAWGRKRGWRGGCTFCDIGRYACHRYLGTPEVLNLIGLALGKSDLASRFWRRRSKCLAISFSASGEPLLRYDAVKETIVAIERIFSANRIQAFFSVCTSGIAEGVKQMLEDVAFCDKYRVQLRFSMHFVNDKERMKFIPAHDAVQRVIDLGTAYAEAVRVKLVIHYALISGINDSDEHARALVKLLHARREHLVMRVSRINPDCGAERIKLSPPSKSRRRKFIRVLKEGGLECSPVWEGYARWVCNSAHFR